MEICHDLNSTTALPSPAHGCTQRRGPVTGSQIKPAPTGREVVTLFEATEEAGDGFERGVSVYEGLASVGGSPIRFLSLRLVTTGCTV